VAVLKIEANNLSPLPFAPSALVGSTVYCLSHPELSLVGNENGYFTFTKGMVCGKFRLRLGGDKPLNVLAITADYGKGSSGGPILNENGAVVGMVSSTMALLDDPEGNVQMTWKFTRPSSSILALLQGVKRHAVKTRQGRLSR
jgi:S1-C subfamily serine protease